ncbi:hypothetical protein ACWIVU_04295 [Ursidibacter arcticus]
MNDTEVILLITEGERLDIRILNQVKKSFLPEKSVKIFPICLNIYNLYKKMSQYDDFGTEFIDIFVVIKEIIQEQNSSNNTEFLALKRSQISEIFLFFDFDGHDTLVSQYPNCINEMFELFSDETENGKLYINYPMVESYKHPVKNQIEIIDIFNKTHYKTFVASICDKRLEQISKMDKNAWLDLFLPHLKSSNHLFFHKFELPKNYVETQEISQLAIYEKQKQQHIDPNKQVMVLSSFSWFLLEYLGEPLFLEWQNIDNQGLSQ